MQNAEHFVEYEKYCETCMFRDLKKNENGDEPEPCNECLTYPVNTDSRKPIKYIKREEKKKKDDSDRTTEES